MRQLFRTLPVLIVIFAAPLLGKTTYPEPTGHVNDFASVLSAQSRNRLENLLTTLNAQTGVEIAVVTWPALNDAPIDDVSMGIAEQWKIGKKGQDNGLLFLIAPNDRKMRIEVGYGLEPILPDAMTGRIQDNDVIPEFRAGNMDAGIVNGTEAIVGIIAKHYKLNPEDLNLKASPNVRTKQSKQSPLQLIFKVIIIIIAIIIFIKNPTLFFLLFLNSGGRGSGGSGGFGGGFGGFGGGSFGGGGSSRSW